jgi:hypothetical protein
MLFAALNLLAFAFHTICDVIEGLWRKASQVKRSGQRFFEHVGTVTADLIFPNRAMFLQTLIASKRHQTCKSERKCEMWRTHSI